MVRRESIENINVFDIYTRIQVYTRNSPAFMYCCVIFEALALIIAISGYIWNSHFYMQACVHDRKSSGFL